MKIINGGQAVGYIYNLNKTNLSCSRVCSDAKKEEELLYRSLKQFKEKLELLQNKTTENVKDIIEIYLAFLNDFSVINEIKERINKKHECAGKASEQVINKYVLKLKESDNLYLKERANDFLDLKDMIIKEMYQKNEELIFHQPTILVVDSLSTSLALTLSKEVKGVISRTGGELSHAAIVLKEKNIPFIVSNKKFANQKIVYLNTKKEKLEQVDSLLKNGLNQNLFTAPLNKVTDFKINLYLNLSSLECLKNPHLDYYKGVGLVRSEHLWINEFAYPHIEEQINNYKKILSKFYPKQVKIRLFDIKKDKGLYVLLNEEAEEFKLNGPFKKLYKDQLKALILANETFGNLQIIIPMINDVKEFQAVKEYLISLKKELNLSKNIPKLGIMLETSTALSKIEQFKIVDFINIGTNDLAKELFGIDRKKSFNREKIISKILKKLEQIKDFEQKYQIPYLYCGDLVSTEFGLKKLLEKGETDFSVADGFLLEAIEIIDKFKRKSP